MGKSKFFLSQERIGLKVELGEWDGIKLCIETRANKVKFEVNKLYRNFAMFRVNAHPKKCLSYFVLLSLFQTIHAPN